ncbi:MAG: dihydropteroate synthase [Thermoplasmatota archaeon]
MFGHLRVFPHRDAAREDMQAIDVEPAGVDIMAPKTEHHCIKLYDLAAQDALIMKQEMLSLGGDAAISRRALPPCGDPSDVLVMGTIPQLQALAEKLTRQYDRLCGCGETITSILDNLAASHTLRLGDGMPLGERTIIMGILNVTPDSFYDGSRYAEPDAAVERALDMAEAGADIIDVGGESTRPGAAPVNVEEELARVVPIIEAVTDAIDVPVSIDTSKATVAGEAITAGAGMVNDVTALRGDPDMAGIVAEHDVPVCLMHMQGTPREMQDDPAYEDVMGEICHFLYERACYAQEQGVSPENIILDPGIGFGKRTGADIEDNCEILARLGELKSLGFPVMVGASRKAFIGNLCGCPPEERLEGSLGAAAMAIANGADILRVHDVEATRRMTTVVDRIARKGR